MSPHICGVNKPVKELVLAGLACSVVATRIILRADVERLATGAPICHLTAVGLTLGTGPRATAEEQHRSAGVVQF